MTSSVDPTKQTDVLTPLSGSAPFKITPINTKAKYTKMLVYGKHGSGKTTTAVSAVDVPDMRDVLLINCESGDMSVVDNDRIHGLEFLDDVAITEFRQVAYLHDFLQTHCRLRDMGDIDGLREQQAAFSDTAVADIETPKQYRTVIIDSLTELNDMCLYQILGITVENALTSEIEVAHQSHFRKANQMMQLLIRAFKDLPLNVIFVSAAKYEKDELQQMHWQPRMVGQLAVQVQGFVDIVAYMMVGDMDEGDVEAPRRLYVQPTGRFDAKNRRASFKGAYFDDPTMVNIMSGYKMHGM